MAVLDPNDYRRIAAYTDRGFLTSTGRRQELWLGADHLLELHILRYSERSRRYYLRDVRAITVDETDARRLYTLLWLSFAVLFAGSAALLFTFGGTNPFALGAGAAAAGGLVLMVLGLLRNVVNGPTCRCQLHTAVQSADLFSLPRFRKAERFLREIVPAIEAAQGSVNVEAFATSPEATTIPASPYALGSARRLRHESGNIHLTFFAFLMFDAVAGSLLMWMDPTGAFDAVTLFLILVYVLLNIMAFMRQANTDLSNSIKNLTWGAFALLMTSYIIGVSVFSYYVGANPELYDPTAVQFTGREFAPVVYFFSAIEFILGVAGVYLVVQHRRLHDRLTRAAAAMDLQ